MNDSFMNGLLSVTVTVIPMSTYCVSFNTSKVLWLLFVVGSGSSSSAIADTLNSNNPYPFATPVTVNVTNIPASIEVIFHSPVVLSYPPVVNKTSKLVGIVPLTIILCASFGPAFLIVTM